LLHSIEDVGASHDQLRTCANHQQAKGQKMAERLNHGCDWLFARGKRRLFERLGQLAAEVGDELAQGCHGAGGTGVR
jgi:hypothetical protein